VDVATKKADGIDINTDAMPSHYNHSYVREYRWVKANLLRNEMFVFDKPTHDVLSLT
jgi:hypothetical protein